MELEQRVLSAQANRDEINSLISDYLPLIKSEVHTLVRKGADFDDMLTIGMLAFVNAINRYDAMRGSFIALAKVCIRNRIIDELRRNKNQVMVQMLPFQNGIFGSHAQIIDNVASIDSYNKDEEQKALADEIRRFRLELGKYNITFYQLPDICPKQDRSRKQCIHLAKSVAHDKVMRQSFLKSKRIPITTLAKQYKISPKTIEKHRKYIVTIILLLLGDYAGIRTFLPYYKEVD